MNLLNKFEKFQIKFLCDSSFRDKIRKWYIIPLLIFLFSINIDDVWLDLARLLSLIFVFSVIAIFWFEWYIKMKLKNFKYVFYVQFEYEGNLYNHIIIFCPNKFVENYNFSVLEFNVYNSVSTVHFSTFVNYYHKLLVNTNIVRVKKVKPLKKSNIKLLGNNWADFKFINFIDENTINIIFDDPNMGYLKINTNDCIYCCISK